MITGQKATALNFRDFWVLVPGFSVLGYGWVTIAAGGRAGRECSEAPGMTLGA